jgi:ABC-type transport system substrate-binding protein
MKKNLLIASGISLFGMLIMACSSEPKPENRTASGDVVLGGEVFFSGKPYTSILPSAINDLASAQAASNVLEGLTRIAADGKVVPALAESFESDSSASVYKFTLRKGVKFQDDACFSGGEGREFNAEDVKFSFEQLCTNKPSNAAFASTFKNVLLGAEDFYAGKTKELNGIQVVDDYTVVIKTLGPNEALPALLAGIQFSIVPKEAVERYAEKAAIGTGPFAIKLSDGAYKLVRNPSYYGKDAMGNQLPYLDQVSVKQVEAKTTEIEQVLKGELDVVVGLNSQVANQVVQEHLKDFEANGKFVMESSDEVAASDVFIIRKSQLKGFKLNADGTVNWAIVQKLAAQ